MNVVVAAFNREKPVVGTISVTKQLYTLRSFQALVPVLGPALPLVRQLVGAVEDDSLVAGRLRVHRRAEPGPPLLDAGGGAVHLDLQVVT